MKTRLIKGKLTYFRGIFDRNNELIKEIVKNPKSKLGKEIDSVLLEMCLSKNEFMGSSIDDIKMKSTEFDNHIWLSENLKKRSLEVYNSYKTEIKQKNYYNEEKSLIISKMKTNTLNLNDRKWFNNEPTKCELCGYERETLTHFLLYCPALEDVINNLIELQRPREESEVNVIGKLLFKEKPDEKNIYKMWITRKK